MIDDHKTIEYRKHYETTKKNEQRIKDLEKKVKALNNLVMMNNLT